MYEEDRNRALEMYDEIFDEVNNDTAVLQLLVSPTRQAVNLARAYDARERKYQDEGQEPAYQLVIEDLRREADKLIPTEPKFEEGQLSLFNDNEATENVFDSLGFDMLHDLDEKKTAPEQTAPLELGLFPDEDREGEPAPLAPPPAAPAVENAAEMPAQEVDDFSDAVDAFLADFTLNDDFAQQKEPAAEENPVSLIRDEDEPAEEAVQHVAEKAEPHLVMPPISQEKKPVTVQEPHPVRTQSMRTPSRQLDDLPDLTGTAERKANVPLLILFILLAIPVGLLCAGVLIAAALLFLGLAALAVCVGVSGVIAAFSFSVFADILLVFGLALALTAIGLLLLWVFIWLLAGAIPGVVRAIAALGRKLCYKEVSA